MTNNNLHDFDAFLDLAAKSVACGEECQRQRTAEELRQKYLNAATNVELAKPEYDLSKRTYQTYVYGQQASDEMMEQEYATEADQQCATFLATFRTSMNELRTRIETQTAVSLNEQHVTDLCRRLRTENQQLVAKLKGNANDVLTNERKTFYESQQIDALNLWYTRVLWTLYIAVCVGVLVAVGTSSTLTWKSKLGILVGFLVLPQISTWLLERFLQLTHLTQQLLPTNVYLTRNA